MQSPSGGRSLSDEELLNGEVKSIVCHMKLSVGGVVLEIFPEQVLKGVRVF